MDNFHHKQNKAELHVLAALMHMLGYVINQNACGHLEVKCMMVPVFTICFLLTMENFQVFPQFLVFFQCQPAIFLKSTANYIVSVFGTIVCKI